MSKRPRIILVTNSVPLAVTDFLKHKLFGVSQLFDTHLFCWGTNALRDEFYVKYGDRLRGRKIHLFYSKWSTSTLIRLVFINLLRLVFYPHVSVPLFAKMIRFYGWDMKKLFLKFSLYFPVIKLRPGIVHFEFGTLAHKFSDLKEFTDAKLSVSFRGYDINYVGLGDAGYYDKVWRNFDGFHFLGNDLKNRAIKRGYIAGKVEALIAPAIDTSIFKPTAAQKNEAGFVIISLGRLAWKKGYEYALKAIALVKDKGLPVTYKIIGDGEYRQAVQFAISELGLQDEVVLLGVLGHEAIRDELAKADVFLHAAVSEGFCNAVVEAQAMALPVVTTNADGLSENIEDGKTGFVVPVYDAVALADKLEWCYKHRAALPEMGKAGVERVRKHFMIEEQVKKFEEFYMKVYQS